MANNRKNSNSIKRSPPLVDLAPPRAKPGKPAAPPKRKLSPLPEMQLNTPNNQNKPQDKVRPVQPTTVGQYRQPYNSSTDYGRKSLPVTGERLGRGTQQTRQENRRPVRRMSPNTKRNINIGISVVVVGTLIIMLGIFLFGNTALAVLIDGVPIGYIPLVRETTSESFHNEVVTHLESKHLTGVIVSQQVTVDSARRVSRRGVTDRSIMISQIGLRIEYQIVIRAIYIADRFEVYVRSEHCVTDIENRIKAEWTNENTVESIFDTDWRIDLVAVDRDHEGILSSLEAIAILDRTEMFNIDHIVESGDTLDALALRFGTTSNSIANANNITLVTTIRPGDVLTIRTRQPILSVITIDEVATYSPIEMPVETQETSDRYESTTYIVQEGSPGERRTVQRITRRNGITTNTEQLDAEVIAEPITHIVEVGTRTRELERR